MPPELVRPARFCRAALAALLLAGALGGCACRGGYVGPYGGVHPARCWAW